ncbi:V-ATPase V1 sector subunit E [Naganishia albida]|nr:V-ATPase V1 sector subunit E [Naganishia albida]
MSRAGALNDSEMASEMNKMVAFISQEAREKAREIQVKADEEFAIEKAKIVRQETAAIDAQFEKKRKQAEVSWKISQSTALNQSRLEVLRSRAEHLDSIFDETKTKVKDLNKDSDKYQSVLEGLILEILLILVSPDVLIEHTPSASDVVKKAGDSALDKYTEMSGRTSKIEYKDSLSDDTCSGGVVGSMMQGRIKVNNTLDERLHILEEEMLPEIRTDLFGKNPSRRFYN